MMRTTDFVMVTFFLALTRFCSEPNRTGTEPHHGGGSNLGARTGTGRGKRPSLHTSSQQATLNSIRSERRHWKPLLQHGTSHGIIRASGLTPLQVLDYTEGVEGEEAAVAAEEADAAPVQEVWTSAVFMT